MKTLLSLATVSLLVLGCASKQGVDAKGCEESMGKVAAGAKCECSHCDTCKACKEGKSCDHHGKDSKKK